VYSFPHKFSLERRAALFEQAPYFGGSVGEETAAVSNLFKNKAAAGNDMGRSGRHVCTLVKHKKGAESKSCWVCRGVARILIRRRRHATPPIPPRPEIKEAACAAPIN